MSVDQQHDILQLLSSNKPCLWVNPLLGRKSEGKSALSLVLKDIEDAEQRLRKFAPLLESLFPELQESKGIIESELLQAPSMLAQLNKNNSNPITGKLWIKGDHNLPVAGSIKARGGIYEVLCFAEELAMQNGILEPNGDYGALETDNARQLFEKYSVSVGSTGNLGLSIGVMSAALGFRACVHMSVEAKEWKKVRLRKRGVKVVEHTEDYSKVVAAGRQAADQDPYAYFVDDENSLTLFLGYSVAALRLERQLQAAGVVVDDNHPLFVYIPCGVGGAPGGITFGLKQVFGRAVHCFFAEPTQASSMLLGMATGFENNLSVYDIGLHADTEADGLAVSQASKLVGELMVPLLSGIFTVEDERLFQCLYQLQVSESLHIEPSAAAGFDGPGLLLGTDSGRKYLREHGLTEKMTRANHIIWTTGGRFVPDEEYETFHLHGKALCEREVDLP